jgi:hypothetical protein
MKKTILLVVLGGCGSPVPNASPDASSPHPDAAAPAPDAAVSAFTSCADIATQMPGAPSGEYTIDPDGAGGAAPFAVRCEMAVAGGGWTQVTQTLAASLTSGPGRQYLYLYGSKGYESPCTTVAWSWTSAQQVTGTYSWWDDTDVGTFACAGSAEPPSWGVGCSNGGGPTNKVLPATTENPPGGTSTVCQDSPNAFGATPCVDGVSIFEKEGCTP